MKKYVLIALTVLGLIGLEFYVNHRNQLYRNIVLAHCVKAEPLKVIAKDLHAHEFYDHGLDAYECGRNRIKWIYSTTRWGD